MKYEELNNRQLVASAAGGIWAFCKKSKVNAPVVKPVLQHCVGILASKNLSEWDAGLRRYDFEQALLGDADILYGLIEFCLEIAIVDLYGGNTHWPKHFFDGLQAELSDHGLTSPISERYVFDNSSPWGKPIATDIVEQILKEFDL